MDQGKYLNLSPCEKAKHDFFAASESTRASACSLRNWMFIDADKTAGKQLSALEQFIHENEPAGIKESEKFRNGLIAVLEEAND